MHLSGLCVQIKAVDTPESLFRRFKAVATKAVAMKLHNAPMKTPNFDGFAGFLYVPP
jgi:hypothetical protein